MKRTGITVFWTFVVTLLMILHPSQAEAMSPIDIPLATVEWDLSAQAVGLTETNTGTHTTLYPFYTRSIYVVGRSGVSAAEASFSASNFDRAYSSSAHLWGDGPDYAIASIDVWSNNFSNMTALSISFDY